ncbi:MAG: serine/threonine protein kinase [Acidobacteria bacterium]|nr:serine/threonine protein kinase [Acidobacteriota bacterium]
MTGTQFIGRYQILGELGRGAMGIVYRAHDPAIGRTVALKTFPVGAGSAEAQRLRREAKVTGVLSHPGIVTVYDVVESGEAVYICMECVEGPTLESLMSSNRALSPKTVLDIIRQAAIALDYAHSKGIVHRDIKPGNLMLHQDRVVKITDFGIAKIMAEDATLTGPALGTPNYMSPEQIQMKPVGGRCDQFSLAVIAYELLTGQKPFAGYSLASIVYKACNELPPPASSCNPTLPPEADAVLDRALAKDPAARYANVVQFIYALETSLGNAAWMPVPRGQAAAAPTMVAAETTGRTTRSRVPPPKSRSWAGVVAFFFSLAGFSAVALAIYLLTPSGGPIGLLNDSVTQKPAVTPVEGDKPSPSVGESTADAGPTEPQSPNPTSGATSAPADTPEAKVPESGPVSKGTSAAADPPIPPAPKGEATEAGPPPLTAHSFSLESTPGGALVTFDNIPAFTCTTPCKVTLAAGRHTLRAQLDGFRPLLKVIDVPSASSLQLVLERSTGTVMAKSNPPGATIVVDGREWPSRTPTVLTLPAGRHRIQFKKEGHRDEESIVDLREGAVMNLDISWPNP